MSRPVRRSQAISPFGIGALVDFPGPVSLVHAGLDAWPFDETNPNHREFRIDDEKRLARRLHVDFFVQPPDYRIPMHGNESMQKNLGLKLPYLRFPSWHLCPRCGRMHLARLHSIAAPVCNGPIGTGGQRGQQHSPRKTVQVRFVAACEKGHMRDFPWLEWLFRSASPDWQTDDDSQWLRLRSMGSASLTGFEIIAERRMGNGDIEIVQRRPVASAFASDPDTGAPSALARIGVRCNGNNPVLGRAGRTHDGEGCGHPLHPLLRGASNLYFPHVVSSIYIPDIDDRALSQEIVSLLDDEDLRASLLDSALNSEDGLISPKAARIALKKFHAESDVDPVGLAEAANRHILKEILLADRKVQAFLSQRIKISEQQKPTIEIIQAAIRHHCPDWEIDPELLLPAILAWFENRGDDGDESRPVQDSLSESDYRREEYRVFCRDFHEGYSKTNLLIRSTDIGSYGRLVTEHFERISLLHKLRETRAFVGFSRIYPENELTPEEKWQLIALEKKRWLPAVIVRGEGIFLKFREDRLRQWINRHGTVHEGRLAAINTNLGMLRARRHQQPKLATAKQVLIHTFAHLLINQLVYECGYGSAALRERIYAVEGDDAMSGVLIYTAAGDSEGTMGGLVQMGQAGHLERVIANALEKARWCSSDPVCIESHGQGPDNCNMAACHSCALLPETSCEEQNRLLDRGVVIGTIEQPGIGYFDVQP